MRYVLGKLLFISVKCFHFDTSVALAGGAYSQVTASYLKSKIL